MKREFDLIAERGDFLRRRRESLRLVMFDRHDPYIVARRRLLEGAFRGAAVIIVGNQRGDGFFAFGGRIINDSIDLALDQER